MFHSQPVADIRAQQPVLLMQAVRCEMIALDHCLEQLGE
ncbi:hypothetical protein KPSA3_07595 [Pseudomonas syringae pv. actinidiae]|uniref:Uncharacterized protein n=1 Tax=Pseudomonas syringae pv. actinidiae TaxID=103796 RepID=A0AAN4QCI8_PSESF|nr:hypothetical protein KPSA3_07595 [Pseudomonas syringae pv. actinidiae]